MGKKVLICDGQELIRQVLSQFLSKKGLDVTVASTGSECLQLAATNKFDAFILDLTTPDIDGISLINQLKAKSPNSRFILMSAQPSDAIEQENANTGFQFFKKPFSLHSIFEGLKSLGGKKATRILVVDDQDFLRELLADYLHQKGFDVKEARNGQEAVEMARKNEFDGILMDIRMPDLDGILALKKLQAEGIHTPVILMSGFSDITSREDAKALGAVDFLPKPFKLEAASGLLADI
ncbi:MAG: response regulator [Myxococcota bacterium]